MGLKGMLLYIKNESYNCCVLFQIGIHYFLRIYSFKWKFSGAVIINPCRLISLKQVIFV